MKQIGEDSNTKRMRRKEMEVKKEKIVGESE